MSKIEEYQKAKQIAKSVQNSVVKCLGKDSPTNDKHEVRCQFSALGNMDWSPMLFRIYASHGYFGCSSCYSDTSEALGKYLAKAINKNLCMLLLQSVEFAKEDMLHAREAAEDEAREVLEAIND